MESNVRCFPENLTSNSQFQPQLQQQHIHAQLQDAQHKQEGLLQTGLTGAGGVGGAGVCYGSHFYGSAMSASSEMQSIEKLEEVRGGATNFDLQQQQNNHNNRLFAEHRMYAEQIRW